MATLRVNIGRRTGLNEKLPTIATCECTHKSAGARHPGLGKVTHQFVYRSAKGAHAVFSRFRFEPPEGGKTYRYCPCYKTGCEEHAALLYGAHRVAEKVNGRADRIHLTEGEKDAEAFWKPEVHECGTTAHTGVNFTAEMAESFRGYAGQVWVYVDRDHLDGKHASADRDVPGAVAALRKFRALLAVGLEPQQIKFREAAVGKDVEDHFSAGKTVEDFRKVSRRTLERRAPKEAGRTAARSLAVLHRTELPEGPALRRILEVLERAKAEVEPLPSGEYKTRCPNPDHPDTNASFEFGQGEQGAVGFCRSWECEDTDWLRGLRLKRADLFDKEAAQQDDVLAGIEALFLQSEGFDLSYADRLYSDEDILALTPPEFAIDGWIPQGFYSVLYGEPGAKKTFALLDMAKSIRRGVAWQGHPVQKGAVLFFQGEGLEQLTPRIQAWTDHHGTAAEDAPGAYATDTADLTLPRGVAAVVRTVQDFQRENDCRVVAVVVDPLVEFMTGEENGEGMELASRGLRAIAQYLNIAVVVGHHTNAAGARARGGDWLRMRAGAHIRAETLSTGQTGLVQQKQKNAEKLAVVLDALPVGGSLVLQKSSAMTAVQYAAEKDSTEGTERAQSKIKLSATQGAAKREQAAKLLVQYVRDHPGLSQTKVIGGCTGAGMGKPVLESVLAALCEEDGPVIAKKSGTAINSPIKYQLRE